MATKRKKPQNLYPVKDLQQANATLAEIAMLKRKLETINLQLSEDIDRLKVDAEVEAAPLETSLKQMENGLLAFAEHNKDEIFKDKRSKELTFGTLGYRKSSEVSPKPKHTLAMILGKLEEMEFDEAIRVDKKVNKDVLRTWPDERLDLVGARRVHKDTFWYEVKEEEIKDAGV